MTLTTKYRIIHRMKITAILPDELIAEIRQYTGGKNITESLSIALRAWLTSEKMKELNQKIEENPLEFDEKFSVFNLRDRR